MITIYYDPDTGHYQVNGKYFSSEDDATDYVHQVMGSMVRIHIEVGRGI